MENDWVDGRVKQRVLSRLGRLDQLLDDDRLDALVQSLGRFSEKLAVLGAQARGESVVAHSSRIGPAPIFQRRWETYSIDQVLRRLLRVRPFEFYELAGGVLPCGRFGANAAWLRFAVLTFNVLTAMKRLPLPA